MMYFRTASQKKKVHTQKNNVLGRYTMYCSALFFLDINNRADNSSFESSIRVESAAIVIRSTNVGMSKTCELQSCILLLAPRMRIMR